MSNLQGTIYGRAIIGEIQRYDFSSDVFTFDSDVLTFDLVETSTIYLTSKNSLNISVNAITTTSGYLSGKGSLAGSIGGTATTSTTEIEAIGITEVVIFARLVSH